MKKTETVEVRFIKLNTALILALICLVAGFIGGNIYSVYKSSSAQTGNQTYAPVQASAPGPPVDHGRTQQILALEKQTAAEPENKTAWLQLGNLYYDSDIVKKAIQAYNKYLDLDPDNPDVWTDLGVMLRRNQQPQEAIAAFEKAMALDPEHEQSRFNKGVVLLSDLKNRDGAVKVWTELLKINPTFRTPNGVPLINYMGDL